MTSIGGPGNPAPRLPNPGNPMGTSSAANNPTSPTVRLPATHTTPAPTAATTQSSATPLQPNTASLSPFQNAQLIRQVAGLPKDMVLLLMTMLQSAQATGEPMAQQTLNQLLQTPETPETPVLLSLLQEHLDEHMQQGQTQLMKQLTSTAMGSMPQQMQGVKDALALLGELRQTLQQSGPGAFKALQTTYLPFLPMGGPYTLEVSLQARGEGGDGDGEQGGGSDSDSVNLFLETAYLGEWRLILWDDQDQCQIHGRVRGLAASDDPLVREHITARFTAIPLPAPKMAWEMQSARQVIPDTPPSPQATQPFSTKATQPKVQLVNAQQVSVGLTLATHAVIQGILAADKSKHG